MHKLYYKAFKHYQMHVKDRLHKNTVTETTVLFTYRVVNVFYKMSISFAFKRTFDFSKHFPIIGRTASYYRIN